VPVVGMVHHPLHIDRQADFEIDARFKYRWRRTLYFPMLMQEFVVPRLSRVITVSHASARAIDKYFGVPEADVPVVYNGTDTEIFRPVPSEKEADLIFIGRTEDRKKGIGPLIEAFARTPRPITLKIVDGRIPEDGLVMKALRRHGIEDRVQLVRRMLTVEELVAEYSTARIALVPSFFEGFGFPASEAMACGLPVIATANGALPEVVGPPGEAGLIVPFGNVDALAGAMEKLALDRPLASEMGAEARRRIEQVFSWRLAGERTAEVLAEVVRAHRRS
jgi:glycosyltransferase involved in cell wall biosynthesis